MAKVTAPLLSMDASGTVGDTLTFSKVKGVNYVRQRVIPMNPQTALQQAVRGGLAGAGKHNSFVEATSDIQVALNAVAPSNMSGASYFAGKMAKNAAAAKIAYNTVGNSTVKGYFDSAATGLGLGSVTIPGETPLVVTGGEILWNAYDCMYPIDPTIASTVVASATAETIGVYTAALAAA